MVDQRDTADVRVAHMEKRANKDEVQAQESSELSCSETSLIGLESSDMFGILPAQQPPQTQTNHKTRGGRATRSMKKTQRLPAGGIDGGET